MPSVNNKKIQDNKALFEQLKADYAIVFEGDRGKRVLEDIKRAGFFYTDPYHREPTDTARNLGMLRLARHIDEMTKPSDTKKEPAQRKAVTENG